MHEEGGPSSGLDPTRINLDPTGHFQVIIEEAFCQQIGEGCGLTKQDVEEALYEDNMERAQAQATGAALDTEGIDQSVFDPDPEDEIGSEEELQ